jgi:hypothetical protein
MATSYLVFRLDDEHDDQWERCSVFVAASSTAAKQQAALTIGAGTYAAVPQKSWQPSAFKVESRAVAVKPA